MSYIMTYNSLVTDIQTYTNMSNAVFIAQIPQFIAFAEYRIAKELKQLEGKRTALGTFTAGQAYYPLPARWRQTISVNYAEETPYSTYSRQRTSNITTLVFDDAQPFAVGDAVVVYNIGGTGYNGNFTVSAATQFSISYSNSGGTEAVTLDSGGTVMATPESYNPIYPRELEHCRTYWPNLAEMGNPTFYADAGNSNGFNVLLIVPTPAYPLPFQIIYYENPEQLSESNQQNWITQNCPELMLYATLMETAPFLKNDNRLPIWQAMYDRAMQAKGAEAIARIKDASEDRNIGT